MRPRAGGTAHSACSPWAPAGGRRRARSPQHSGMSSHETTSTAVGSPRRMQGSWGLLEELARRSRIPHPRMAGRRSPEPGGGAGARIPTLFCLRPDWTGSWHTARSQACVLFPLSGKPGERSEEEEAGPSPGYPHYHCCPASPELPKPSHCTPVYCMVSWRPSMGAYSPDSLGSVGRRRQAGVAQPLPGAEAR